MTFGELPEPPIRLLPWNRLLRDHIAVVSEFRDPPAAVLTDDEGEEE